VREEAIDAEMLKRGPTLRTRVQLKRNKTHEQRGKVSALLGSMTARLDELLQQVGSYKSTNTDAAAGTNVQILTRLLAAQAHELDDEYQQVAETSALAECELEAIKRRGRQSLVDKLVCLQHDAELGEIGIRELGERLVAVESVATGRGGWGGERDRGEGGLEGTVKAAVKHTDGSTSAKLQRRSKEAKEAKDKECVGEALVVTRGERGGKGSVVAVVKRPSTRWHSLTGTYVNI
jgi:hypothetical protein